MEPSMIDTAPSPAHQKIRPGRLLRSVTVALGDRAYDVLIGPGLLAEAGTRISTVLGARRCAIVTDTSLEQAGHLAALSTSLTRGGVDVLGAVVLPSGEATKSFAELQRVTESLLGFGVERRDVVIALGGGVIGDLTGFAAAILRRGVRFVQIPTTLLAQVDSSVGGKTAINSRHGKNLIGAFHQPSLVLADIEALATLPDRQMRAGYAEVAKHAALGDAAYFDWLQTNVGAVLAREPSALVHAVARSVEMKAAIVERDETEQGDRMLLNLGHTFGHALEAWAGFSDRLLHGEAVAMGTAIAFRFSASRGLCSPGDAARVARHLTDAGLPTRIGDLPQGPRPSVAELMTLMAQDKKVRDGRMTFILARAIGAAFVSREVEGAEVERWLAAEIAGTA
jgi:3-dehydroquinate synthase